MDHIDPIKVDSTILKSTFLAQMKETIDLKAFQYTVVTPNKGQSNFDKIGSNKGISQLPLFVIFDKWC